MSEQFCQCQKPRAADVRICIGCGKSVLPGEAIRDNMGDEYLTKRVHDLERQQRQLQLDIQALKSELKTRAASREQPSR